MNNGIQEHNRFGTDANSMPNREEKCKMGIQKTEKIKKYYTWKGNAVFAEYYDYKEAQTAAKNMGQKILIRRGLYIRRKQRHSVRKSGTNI